MTLNEFKAWFDGYTENIKDQPNKKQWARIQEKMDELTEEYRSIYTPWYTHPFSPTVPYVTYSDTTGNPPVRIYSNTCTSGDMIKDTTTSIAYNTYTN